MKSNHELTAYFVESVNPASLEAEIADLGVVTLHHQALVFKYQHSPVPLIRQAWQKYHRLTVAEYNNIQTNYATDIVTLEIEAVAETYLRAINSSN